MTKGPYVEYSSNNSGGSWWLDDQDWKALEAAGWEVNWRVNDTDWTGKPYPDGRWLGALATTAKRYGVSEQAAIAEFEDATGEYAGDDGCDCCGPPHSFYSYDANGDMQF